MLSSSSGTLTQLNDRRLDPVVEISLPPTLTSSELDSLLPSSHSGQQPAFTFPALHNWLTRLIANLEQQKDPAHPFHKYPYKLRSLDIQAVDWFWRGKPGIEDKLGYMKLQADITTDAYVHGEGEEATSDWLPGAVFLRGGSVGILASPNTYYDRLNEKT
jgi:hypothetical protein